MSAEEAIADHLRARMAEAYPEISEKNVQIFFPGGRWVTDRNKGRTVIGSEELVVELLVHTKNPIDRRPFVRSVPRREVDADGYRIFQEYGGHEFRDYPDAANMKTTVFKLTYTHDIEEA